MKLNKKEAEYLKKLLDQDISQTKSRICEGVEESDMDKKLKRDRRYELLWDVENAVSIRAKLEAEAIQ